MLWLSVLICKLTFAGVMLVPCRVQTEHLTRRKWYLLRVKINSNHAQKLNGTLVAFGFLVKFQMTTPLSILYGSASLPPLPLERQKEEAMHTLNFVSPWRNKTGCIYQKGFICRICKAVSYKSIQDEDKPS